MRGVSEDWAKVSDPETGRVYWWNAALKQSSWTAPVAAEETLAAAEGSTSSDAAAAHAVTRHLDPSTGAPYWHSEATGETTWHDPRSSSANSPESTTVVDIQAVESDADLACLFGQQGAAATATAPLVVTAATTGRKQKGKRAGSIDPGVVVTRSLTRSPRGGGETLGDALSAVERILMQSPSSSVPLRFCLLAARAASEDELHTLEQSAEGCIVAQYIRALSASDRSLVASTAPSLGRKARQRRLSTVDSLALISFLKSISLFQRLPEHQLVALTANFRVRTYEDGETIIEEGGEGTNFFVVRAGNVGIYKKESANKRIFTHTAGSFFGEVALLQKVKRTASCVAEGRVECLSIDKEHFLESLSAMRDLIGSHYVDYSKRGEDGLVSLSGHIDNFVSVLASIAPRAATPTHASSPSSMAMVRTTSVLAMTAAALQSSSRPTKQWHIGAALRIFSTIAPVLEFDAVANKVLREAMALTRATSIRISLLQPWAVEAAMLGEDIGNAPFKEPFATLYSGEPFKSPLLARLAAAAVTRGLPISVPDVAREPLCDNCESTAQCALVVPLFVKMSGRGALAKRKVIGVVEAIDKNAAAGKKQRALKRVPSYIRGVLSPPSGGGGGKDSAGSTSSPRFQMKMRQVVSFNHHDEATLLLLVAAISPLVHMEDEDGGEGSTVGSGSGSGSGSLASFKVKEAMSFKPTLLRGTEELMTHLPALLSSAQGRRGSARQRHGSLRLIRAASAEAEGPTNAVPGLAPTRKRTGSKRRPSVVSLLSFMSSGSTPKTPKTPSSASSSSAHATPTSKSRKGGLRRRGSIEKLSDGVRASLRKLKSKSSPSLGPQQSPADQDRANADAGGGAIAGPSWTLSKPQKRTSLQGMSVDTMSEAKGRALLSSGLALSLKLFHGDTALGHASEISVPLPGDAVFADRCVDLGINVCDCPRSSCVVVELLWREQRVAVGRTAVFNYTGALEPSRDITLEIADGLSLPTSSDQKGTDAEMQKKKKGGVDDQSEPIVMRLELIRSDPNESTPIAFRYYSKESSARSGGGVLALDERDEDSPALPSRANKPAISRKHSSQAIVSSPREGVQRSIDLKRTQSRSGMSPGVSEELLDLVKRINGLHLPSADEREELWSERVNLSYHPAALPAVMLSVPWHRLESAQEAHALLERWDHSNARIALQLLDRRYPDPAVRTFAVLGLQRLTDDELLVYLLQLTQTLRFEPYSDSSLSRFLLRRALANTALLGHVLYWSLKAEMCDLQWRDMYGQLLEQYLIHCGAHRVTLGLQNFVVQKLKRVQERVRDISDLTAAKVQLREELATIVFPQNVQLPLSPHMRISGLNVEQCSVMDSKMRPLMLSFKRGTAMHVEAGADLPLRVLFKVGDDLRQDQLTLQIMRVMQQLWMKASVVAAPRDDLCMSLYGVVTTGAGEGMIEVVPNAETISKIVEEGAIGSGVNKKKGLRAKVRAAAAAIRSDQSVLKWLRHCCAEGTTRFQDATENFLVSCAAACVSTYVLGIGDRHPSNIMLTKSGKLFHIDFGHFLGNFKTKFGEFSTRESREITYVSHAHTLTLLLPSLSFIEWQA